MQLSAFTSSVARFFSELQRRKVLRVASVYLVAAWIILQVALALQTAMSLAASFSSFVLALLVIGFPIALGLSWFFEVTPEGIKRTVASGDSAPFKPQTADFILAGALALVFSLGVAQFFWPRDTAPVAHAPAVAKPVVDAAQPPRLGDKSIAVLPFANLSPDKENEYFADGLTEELLNLLAKIGDLKVISRTSSFAFKGKNTPLPEIAKQLGVRHILEGSVRAEGDNLRVTAQLIDVATDTHLWSETYERKIEKLFALQDKLARDIAGALKVEITLAESGGNPITNNLNAYRLFLEGLEMRARGTLPSPEATALFRRATALDPRFAEAHAALAASYATRIGVSPPSQYQELSRLARAAAEEAITLKPTLGLAYGVLGLLDRSRRQWESAIGNGEKAVALSPADSNARLWLAGTQLSLGYLDQGAATLGELRRRDPAFDYANGMNIVLQWARGNQAAAEEIATNAVARGLTFPVIHYVLAKTALERRDVAAAERNIKAILPASLRDRPFIAAVARAFGGPAEKADALKAIRAERSEDFNPLGMLLLIEAYDALFDEGERTLTTTQAYNATFFALLWGPQYKEIRSDRRFKSWVKSIGFIDYWKESGWPDRCRPKGEDDFECS